MSLLTRFLFSPFLPPAGRSDSEHRREPGVPGPPGVVPVRHVQPVPVGLAGRLLLHDPGERPQHQAAGGERPHRHPGGEALRNK